jgi:hypothetical protein
MVQAKVFWLVVLVFVEELSVRRRTSARLAATALLPMALPVRIGWLRAPNDIVLDWAPGRARGTIERAMAVARGVIPLREP